jgi:diguanylate cyclase (GGDEF)-like protein
MDHHPHQKFEIVLRDPLTGLASVPIFIKRLQAAVRNARRLTKPLVVMAIEVDEADKYLKKCGPEAFEIILKKVGYLIKRLIRETDFAARYHHSHFIIALVDSSPKGIKEVAARLRQPVEAERFRQGEIHPFEKVSVNISATLYRDVTQTAEDLIEEAEKLLSRARRNKGGTSVSF